MIHKLIAVTGTEEINLFGQVSPPPGVSNFIKQAGDSGQYGGGLIVFITNMLKVVTIVAGLFSLFNIISAGYTYLTSSGNPKATEQAMNQLFMSLIGLIVIVGSYTIVAIVSLLLFGKADFILNPTLPTPAP